MASEALFFRHHFQMLYICNAALLFVKLKKKKKKKKNAK